VIVEYEPQSRIEGEVQQMPADFPVVEFADVVSGRVQGRSDAAQVTVFDSVGFALEDFTALRYLHRLNEAYRDNASRIDLVPELEDPKDLFSLLVPVRLPAPVLRQRVVTEMLALSRTGDGHTAVSFHDTGCDRSGTDTVASTTISKLC
jgi:hypothetical protein